MPHNKQARFPFSFLVKLNLCCSKVYHVCLSGFTFSPPVVKANALNVYGKMLA